MRLDTRTSRPSAPRRAAAAVPAAIVGTIALSLTAAPAQGAEPARDAGARLSLLPTTGVRAAVAVVSATTPATYTVKRGDSVWAIATRHGLRTADVLALNGLSASSVIHPGQVLRLTGSAPAKKGAAPKTAPAKATGSTYTIRKGDTIFAIAARHGVPTASVLSANGLTSSSIIYPGQKITIPGKGAASQPATSTAPAKTSTSAAGSTYTIRKGDTIFAIAAKHGVSTASVLSANGLTSSSIIYPGQKIRIPAKNAPAPAGTASVVLNSKQIENVQLIIRVGRGLGVPERGIAIALGTAMVESGLRNLNYGDRDSVGLFQQRPSTGWGTAAQIQDRVRSTKAFFGGPGNPNSNTRGLLDIAGWQKMTFTQAAQAVQISAYPDAYAKWEKPAYAWLAVYG